MSVGMSSGQCKEQDIVISGRVADGGPRIGSTHALAQGTCAAKRAWTLLLGRSYSLASFDI